MTQPWFNPTAYSPSSMAQCQYALAMYCQSNPAAVQQLPSLPQFSQLGQQQPLGYLVQVTPIFGQSPCANVPKPKVEFSGVPAGQGFKKLDPSAGWGANALEDGAGGVWTFPGSGEILAYKPGSKPGDVAAMRIWGDPHVQLQREIDDPNAPGGKRLALQDVTDFTKDTVFRSTWGTTAVVDTTEDKGQSVAKGIRLFNGSDTVEATGLNTTPTIGAITSDGFQKRAEIPGNLDVLHMGGDAKNIRLFLEQNGVMKGEAQGSSQDAERSYSVKVNDQSQFRVDASLQPPPNTAGWGNQLRGEAVDIATRSNPAQGAQVAQIMAMDHLNSVFMQALGFNPMQNYGWNPMQMFGGYGQFGGMPQQTFKVSDLFQALKYLEIQNQLMANTRAGFPILG